MDYQKFFNEVVEWINHCNQMATQHGMDSDAFWNWVMQSIGEFGNRYNNNQLVVKQMAMLFEWLDDVYGQSKER